MTLPQVYRLADAIDPRFRLVVLLAVFGGLRWGELAALRRTHLDLAHGRIYVRESAVMLRDYTRVTGAPKTQAGVRTVQLPESVVAELRVHLDRFAERKPDGLVFVGAKGAALVRPTFSRPWRKALEKAGLPGIHVHDLRHTGNNLVATTGTSLKELMSRMGHASPRAALIYQHATDTRDGVIAAALEALAEDARNGEDDGDDGTAGVLVPV
ncbi:site-specific integrase [Streptacidiphilus rugosus]|uniref:site-specific integrase n=1 Tax=Streptacidiphilus rugosus TaxID=405783 RepID=UPI0018DCBB79|nr:site-specific integrase [Streptacidiphilus rugosus]